MAKKKRAKGKRSKAKRPKSKRPTTPKKRTTKRGKKKVSATHRLKRRIHHLEAKLREKKRPHRNPRRPPKRWFDRCLASVTARRYVRDPAAVCAAAWWKRPAQERERIVRRLERGTHRDRRAAVAIAKAEHRRYERSHKSRKENPPRKLVQLVYREQKPGDREEYDYVHDFEGDLPDVRMRGGAIQIEGGSYRTKKGWIHG